MEVVLVEVYVYIIVHVSYLHRSKNHWLQMVMHQHQWLVRMYEQILTSCVTTVTNLFTWPIISLALIVTLKVEM